MEVRGTLYILKDIREYGVRLTRISPSGRTLSPTSVRWPTFYDEVLLHLLGARVAHLRASAAMPGHILTGAGHMSIVPKAGHGRLDRGHRYPVARKQLAVPSVGKGYFVFALDPRSAIIFERSFLYVLSLSLSLSLFLYGENCLTLLHLNKHEQT